MTSLSVIDARGADNVCAVGCWRRAAAYIAGRGAAWRGAVRSVRPALAADVTVLGRRTDGLSSDVGQTDGRRTLDWTLMPGRASVNGAVVFDVRWTRGTSRRYFSVLV